MGLIISVIVRERLRLLSVYKLDNTEGASMKGMENLSSNCSRFLKSC